VVAYTHANSSTRVRGAGLELLTFDSMSIDEFGESGGMKGTGLDVSDIWSPKQSRKQVKSIESSLVEIALMVPQGLGTGREKGRNDMLNLLFSCPVPTAHAC
jgi:hypothetical protein